MHRHLKRFTGFLQKKSTKQSLVLPAVAVKLLEQKLFDSSWYLVAYPDVSEEKMYQAAPVLHFLDKGARQGYSPASWFDSSWYLEQNKDVKQAGINPLLHYLQHGLAEGRRRADQLLLNPQLPENQFIRLSSSGTSFVIPLMNRARVFNTAFLFQQYEKPQLGKPCGIVLVECFDAGEQLITSGVKGLSWSAHFKCWYRYLVQNDTEHLDVDKFQMAFPEQAIRCLVTIKPWDARAFEVRNRFTMQVADELVLPAKKVHIPKKERPLTAASLKVALIADEFTYNSFKDEFKAVVLEPEHWRSQFEVEKPDIFFCESAWSGPDSKRRPWRGKIYASINFEKENRSVLLDILNYCRKNGIPTVFWNKEDPTHYTDRKHDFVKTAALFDYVFTSAVECVEQYKKDYKLQHVFALPFATNPRLFNPLHKGARNSNVVFAGSWYANHVDRSMVMEQVLDSLIDKGFTPEIYDRYHGDTDPLHMWPSKYQSYIHPGKPHEQMPAVYSSSVYGLNFNTVTESSTMFARRVFELMSSNTLVISNYSKGVAELFGDLVVFADTDPKRLSNLTETEVDFLREEALNLVLSEHTYSHRWRYMLNCIGFEVKPDVMDVTLVSRINSEQEAMAVISYFEEHFGRDTECRLLLIVSLQVMDLDVAGFYQKFNRFGITVTSESFMQKHALQERYLPIETPYFLLFELATAPAAAWLKKARLHLSYMNEYPLTPHSIERYQLEAVTKDATLFGHSAVFLSIYHGLLNGRSQLAYAV